MASLGQIKCSMKQGHDIWAHLGYLLRNRKGLSISVCTMYPSSCSTGLTNKLYDCFVSKLQFPSFPDYPGKEKVSNCSKVAFKINIAHKYASFA